MTIFSSQKSKLIEIMKCATLNNSDKPNECDSSTPSHNTFCKMLTVANEYVMVKH